MGYYKAVVILNGIYFDNAATSFPKAPGVAEAMAKYITQIGSNVNRSTYDSSYEAAEVVYNTREMLCELFNFSKPENVVFTKNVTEGLNILIKGLLKHGDHVIVSSLEHNAVMRPLASLMDVGVQVTRIPFSITGELDISKLRDAIRSNTKAIIMTHASNVSGTVLDLKAVGKMCREFGSYFIVDTAQTAGSRKVDIEELCADAIAFTGHKGLLGPQGIGGILIKENLADKVKPLIEGGTGSFSDSEYQPTHLPDKFESGTLNIPGIFGLHGALKYLKNVGIETVQKHELELTTTFIEGLRGIDSIKIIGPEDAKNRVPVISIDFLNKDNADVANILCQNYNIMTRCGLHCAPNAHKILGTFPQGTVRFSFGCFNTLKEIKFALAAISKIV